MEQKLFLQIQFLDRNIVSALVPAFSREPDKIVFLYDKRVVSEQGKRDIKNALKKKLSNTEIAFVQANMLQIRDIQEKLKDIIVNSKVYRLEIDITGGTELMTACGLMICREHQLLPTFVDFYQGVMFDVFTCEKIADVVHMKLEDYLCAAGGKLLKASRLTPQEKDFPKILKAAEYVFSHNQQWKDFFEYMTTGYSAAGVMEFSMKENVKNKGIMDMLQVLLDQGFCEKIGKDRYRFLSEADKECMTVYGVWMEKYMYIKAKECYDEVLLGAHIDWNNSDHIDMKDNEIDVIAMKHSQPIFISCKLTGLGKEAVYEVNALAKRLGGEYAKSIVATSESIRAKKDIPNGMYCRLQKMKVGLVEVRDFKKAETADVFARAMQMTE